MTRLAAVEKVLYYPTQARVIERIAAELRLCGVDGQHFSFVDPCCGEGVALARLAELLAASYNDKGGAYQNGRPKVTTCGVEIHRGRYLEAKRRLDRVYNASAFQAVGGGFDVMLLNPPYASGDGSRQEIEFFRACAPLVRPRGGVIAFIPPRKIIAESEFVRAARSLGGWIRVLDYPEPERAEYDQVVVIVVTGADGWRPASQLLVPLSPPTRVVGDVPKGLWSEDWIRVSAPWGEAPSGHLRVSSFDPHAWDRLPVYDSAPWEKTMNLRAHAAARPLVRPRPGHQAMLLAAGCIDGAELAAGVLVKGSSEKASEEVSRDSDKKTVTYRERIRSRVSTLDLATMKLDAWGVEDEPERTAEWFRAHGDALARAVRDVHDPEFDGDVAPWAAKVAALSPPGKLPGHDDAMFLPLQVESACAVAHRWRKHKHVVLSGEMGVGKDQGVSTLTPTPTGWVPIGNLKVGDRVFGRDGQVTTVTGVYPQGVREQVRVVFNDGTAVKCGWEHNWAVQHVRNGRRHPGHWATLTTRQLVDAGLRDGAGNATWRVPMCAPVEYPIGAALPVEPYLLGVILGDGSIDLNGGVSIAKDAELVSQWPGRISIDPRCTKIVRNRLDVPGLREALKTLELAGKRSWEKHVPLTYMIAPVNARLAVLQGLLDTDGYAMRNGGVEFSSTSEKLIDAVVELAQSLGGVGRKSGPRVTRSQYGPGRPSWRVNVKLPLAFTPFRLRRKLDAWVSPTKYQPARVIVAVVSEGVEESVCIRVAAPDSLYLTTGYVVTHNTTIATVASELHGGKLKRIVVCPPHLVAKWIRELEAVTRTKGVARTARKLSDVDAFFRSSSRYLVLSKEAAKLGASWRDAFNRKTIAQVGEREELVEEIPVWPYKVTKRVRDVRRRVEVRCPRCGSDPVTYMEPGAYTDEATMRGQLKQRCKAIIPPVGARTAIVDGVPTAMTAKLAEVRTCGEPLWQAEPLNAKGTLRWPLARYASKRYGGRYVLVVDEAHQYAKADSDQSRAVAQLAAQAAKILVMTGTLYGGRASSIFHLLHKVDPDFRDRYRFEDMPRFVEHHGLFERTVKDEEETSRGGYKRGLSHARVREVPGMTPAMIPLLLPSTIFVKLKDLQVDLPPYREIVELVDADPAVFAEAKRMQMDALAEVRRNPQVLGAYLQACLGYPDAPEEGDEVAGLVRMDGVDLLERKVIASALPVAEPLEGFAKDRRVLEIVEDAWRRGRGVCVFFAQTHRRDARGRVKALLESEGFRVVVLDGDVASDKREEWIRARQAEGFDVMLTNGRLVETGLDLLWAHTIVQYGIEYSVHVLRQSTRRSWRLGQSKPVEVYHLAYKGLLQEIALDLIAKKMRAAEMVDGDDVGGLGRTDVAGGNFLVELAQEVIAASESW